jgi:hypothetical protein
VPGDGLNRSGDDIQLRPPLSACSHAGDGALEVRIRVGEELAARAVVASGCEGAAHGVALDSCVVLLWGDDSKVVLELPAFGT